MFMCSLTSQPFWVLFVVNKVTALPRLHPHSSSNRPQCKDPGFVCIHHAFRLRSPYSFCNLSTSRLFCVYWKRGCPGKRRKSDQCHLHFISMINGISRGSNEQIWVLGASEQAPSAAAVPEAGRQAGAGALRRCRRIRVRVCQRITPSYWVRLYILMSICDLRGALVLKRS